MASYLSKPKEFTPYIAEVNPEMYGAVLQKKEQNYQQGIQRVEAQRDAIAGLPVYNTAGRQYLQQKLDTVTSELNQNVGTDWSDQGIQRLTGKHISAIADDPVIMNSISDSVYYKKDYQKAKESADDTSGADIANQYVWHKDSSKWLNGELGQRYNAGFTPYTNANKVIDDQMSKMYPDIVEQLYPGGSRDKNGTPVNWELAINKIKGTETYKHKVLSELHSIVENTPGLKSQLAVNAEYTYKDHDAKGFINNRIQTNNASINEYDKLITSTDTLLTRAMGSGDLRQVNALHDQKESYIQQKNKILNESNIDHYAMLALAYNFNPEFKKEQDNKLYTDSFINEKYNKFTSDTESTWSFQGMSPLQQQDADWKKKIEIAKLKNENDYLGLAKKKDLRDEKKSQEEDSSGHVFIGKSEINTEKLKHPFQTYVKEIDDKSKLLDQDKKELLYNIYSTAPGVNVDEYFTVDYSSGKPIRGIVPGKEKDVMDNLSTFLKTERKGGYNIAGHEVQLTSSVIDELGRIADEQSLINIDTNTRDKIAKELTDRNKVQKDNELNKAVQLYNVNPINLDYGGERLSITGDVLKKYRNVIDNLHARGLDNYLEAYNSGGVSPLYNDARHIINETISKNHLDINKFNSIHQNLTLGSSGDYDPSDSRIKEFNKIYDSQQEKDDSYLDDRVRTKNLLYMGSDVIISSKGKTDDDKQISTSNALAKVQTQGNLNGWDGEGDIEKLIDKAVTSPEKKEVVITQGWDDDKKSYYYGVQVGTKYGKLWVNPTQATNQQFENLSPRKTILERRLNYNKGNNGEFYNTGIEGQGATVENALTLGSNNGFTYRYHVNHTPKGFYVSVYKIDPTTGKVSMVPDKKSKRNEHFAGTSEYQLDQLLNSLKSQ